LRSSRYEVTDTALEDTPCHEDMTLTSLAYNTDVGSEPYYLPLVAATRMLLPEADYVSQPYLSSHWLSRSIARPVLVYLVTQFCGNLSGSLVEVLTG
jgi:hypothetical protein